MMIYAEGGRTVARSFDGRLEWNAQHLYSVRVDENQSSVVDANDHQIQGQLGCRQIT